MTTATTVRPLRRPRPMSPWRVEWLRLVRTPRAVSLFGVYLVFGLLGPVIAKYLPEILKRVQSRVTVTVPPPVPADGVANYISQVSQTGLLVAVVVAAGALVIDSRRGVSTFLRTRATGMWQLVLPRYAVSALAVVAAYALGTLACWYETALLLGPLPAGPMLAGLLCQTVFLAFAVAVVAAAAGLVRGTLGVVGLALAVLLVLPLAGLISVVHDWMPSTLINAPVELLTTTRLSDYLPALAVSVAATPLLLLAAVHLLDSREV